MIMSVMKANGSMARCKAKEFFLIKIRRSFMKVDGKKVKSMDMDIMNMKATFIKEFL